MNFLDTQGITIKEIIPDFFDSGALIEPNYRLYQLNGKPGRFYYTVTPEGRTDFYPSVTTFISAVVPKEKYLLDWQKKNGVEGDAYMNERANYGTFLHGVFAKLLINGKYNLDGLRGELLAFIDSHLLPNSFIEYEYDLKKDVLALAAFVKDYEVKPLAIEVGLASKKMGLAGTLDLPCTMLEKPGGKNRIRALVDLKSGKKGFYSDHEIQLMIYREIWNENYPDLKIERIFNLSPKDWRNYPTYNLKEQTKSDQAAKLPYYIELGKLHFGDIDRKIIFVKGVIDLSGDLDNNIIELTFSEVVKSKLEEEKPEISENIAEGVTEGATNENAPDVGESEEARKFNELLDAEF